jgi:hypothetical protein
MITERHINCIGSRSKISYALKGWRAGLVSWLARFLY